MSRVGEPSRSRSQRGFTLLELLVVLVIAGLIVAAAPPIYRRFAGATELRQAAEHLANELRNARLEALERNQTSTVDFNLPQKTYRISGATSTEQVPNDIDLTLTSTEIGRVSDTNAHIHFFPDGSSSGGRIELRRKSRQYIISVNWVTGRVVLND